MTAREWMAGPLAAIDMGSNSFRLEIGQLQHGRYRRIDYLKQVVRLGGGLDADGMLTETAARRGLDCLRGFAARLEGFTPTRVRAVAWGWPQAHRPASRQRSSVASSSGRQSLASIR